MIATMNPQVKKVGLIFKRHDPRVPSILKEIIPWLKSRQVEIYLDDALAGPHTGVCIPTPPAQLPGQADVFAVFVQPVRSDSKPLLVREPHVCAVAEDGASIKVAAKAAAAICPVRRSKEGGRVIGRDLRESATEARHRAPTWTGHASTNAKKKARPAGEMGQRL